MARSPDPASTCMRRRRHRFPQLQWQASGGIHSIADLVRLDEMGLAAAISGKALLEGRIRLEELQSFLPGA